jgi:RHS repeat-associated protein
VQAPYWGVWQGHDGDGLRVKNVENGGTTYFLHSTVVGGQVVAELDASGGWMRGYVYAGEQTIAVQAGGVLWTHQDPINKSQRVTDASGNVAETIELDPFGGETNRNSGGNLQPHRYTSWDRNITGDESLFRRYHGWFSRFAHPDPSDGSYEMSDPQSFNRYAYVKNDPVNFVDPSGLSEHPYPTLPRPPGPPIYVVTVTAPPSPASTSGFAGSVLGGDENFVLEQTGGEPGGTDPTGGGPGPQNPYDVRQIIKDVKKKKEINERAWNEYLDCLYSNPRVAEAQKRLDNTPMRSPLPSLARNGSSAALKYVLFGTEITSKGNVFSLTGNVLWWGITANADRDAAFRQLNQVAAPVEKECTKKIQQKYGIVPSGPNGSSRVRYG